MSVECSVAALTMHRVKRITFSAPQPNVGECRKLSIQTVNGDWITLLLYGFQHGTIEDVAYYDGTTP